MDLGGLVPVLIATLFGGGFFSWIVRGWIEERRSVRERIRLEQRERYAQILNPYVQIFAKSADAEKKATDVIMSPEYRKELFDFALVADDDVVRAYNRMIRRFAAIAGPVEPLSLSLGHEETLEGLKEFGNVLLALRKSLGHKRTALSAGEMLQAIGVSEAEQLFAEPSPPEPKGTQG